MLYCMAHYKRQVTYYFVFLNRENRCLSRSSMINKIYGAIFIITDLDFLTICIPRSYAICCYFFKQHCSSLLIIILRLEIPIFLLQFDILQNSYNSQWLNFRGIRGYPSPVRIQRALCKNTCVYDDKIMNFAI